MQYATFYIGDVMYGAPILAVREMSRPHAITPVQGAEQKIEGLMNLRGQIVTVLNLASCLDMPPVSKSGGERVLILKTNKELADEALRNGIETCNDSVALLVDKIGDVVDAEETEVEFPPAHLSHDYISGVIKLEGELLTLLDMKRLCLTEDRGQMTEDR